MTGTDRSLQLRAVRRALECGVNYFDTAAAYGDGRSEENLGGVLAELEATPLIATKVTLEWNDLDDIRSAVQRSVASSLRRLRRDRLDVVHLHNRVGQARSAKSAYGSGALLSIEDVLGSAGVSETLQALQRAGTVGVIGCCAFGGEQSAVDMLIDSGSFASVLVNYSLLNASAMRSSFVADTAYNYGMTGARAARAGVGIVALRILEAGILSGPLGAGSSPDSPSHYRAQLRRLRELPIADAESSDLAALAIRYVLSNSAISTALIGFSSIEQIDAAVEYVERGALPAALVEQLESIHG
jgi:aryl-alcohol dehydrogenase-like predicted oxidoreductase